MDSKAFEPPQFPERFNLADYLIHPNLAGGRADKSAVEFEDLRFSYREIDEGTSRAAGAFRARGVEVENRVLLVLPDCPEFVVAWLGCLRAGAVACAVNPLLLEADFSYYLDYTRARLAVVDAEALERFLPAAQASRWLRALLVRGAGGAAAATGEDFMAALGAAPPHCESAPTHRDDAAVWLFTSGTTGKPKGAVHRHADFAYNIETYAKRVLQIREDDRTLSVPKLFFGYATGTNLMFPFAAGATTCLFAERSTAPVLFDQIERFRPTVLTNVPTMINAMLAEPAAARRDLSSLRICLSAGEALPPELYRRWQQAFGVELLDGIGSAEMFHIYISNVPGDIVPGSLGRLVPGYDARIVDPEGREVGPGEVGTLWVKGGSALQGYWHDHEKSVRTRLGEWVSTGDQFVCDQAGLFWYRGRRDELMKVSGVWVSPIEIEDALLSHPQVAECAVIGAQDDAGLTKPKAFVVLRPGAAPGAELTAALQQHVKSLLLPTKYPRWIEYRDSLPKNDRGKVDRRALNR